MAIHPSEKFGQVFHKNNLIGRPALYHSDSTPMCYKFWFRGWCSEDCEQRTSHKKVLSQRERQDCRRFIQEARAARQQFMECRSPRPQGGRGMNQGNYGGHQRNNYGYGGNQGQPNNGYNLPPFAPFGNYPPPNYGPQHHYGYPPPQGFGNGGQCGIPPPPDNVGSGGRGGGGRGNGNGGQGNGPRG